MNYDFEYITNYIMEYDTGVPNTVILGVLATVCGIIIILSLTSANGKVFIKNAAWCLLIGYLFLTMCATILFREVSENIRYSFIPFLSYTQLYNKLLAEILLNVAMFVPIGYLLGLAKKRMTFVIILKIGCILSLTIEIIQLVSRRGVFNIDDIIHNVLGCVMGFFCFVICYKMIKKIA